MDEFISVAKSLEIKELCNAETEEPFLRIKNTPTELVEEEQTVIPDQMKMQAPKEKD